MARKGIVPKVEIKGAEVLIRNCGVLPVKIDMAVRKTLKEFGFKVANDAKIMCPVDTGRLRASCTVNWSKSGHTRATIKNPSTKARNPSKANDGVGQPAGPRGFQVAVGTNVVYAESVHNRMPYLQAAWDQNKAKYAFKLKAALIGATKI